MSIRWFPCHMCILKVKGKGAMETCFLLNRRKEAQVDSNREEALVERNSDHRKGPPPALQAPLDSPTSSEVSAQPLAMLLQFVDEYIIMLLFL